MYYIGIDLGGTSIKAGLVTKEGDIISKVSASTPVKEGFEGILKRINELVEEIVTTTKVNKENIKAIGVGVPGVCNEEGFIYFATNLFWTNVPLGKRLEELTGIKVAVENDATVAAVAEYTKGVTAQTKNSIFLTLGTGLGGGIIINHQVYSGSHGIGTEIGHVVVGENFYDCTCGNNGCLETFVSATALVKYCKKLLVDHKDSTIFKKVNGDLEKINAKIIFDCAREKDIVALQVIQRMVHYLAIGIGNLINIFDPEVIALGGGVAAAGDVFLEQLQEEIKKYIYVKSMNVTKIAIAQLENDAGIVGSAMYTKLKF
ncbi:MAG: ROK family protein [Clostridiaceae bacterium]|nr:ROK family protein [Clostridiaceae bacterium]